MSNPHDITEQLRAEIRKAGRQGTSRYRLARRAGLTDGALSRFMAGKREPRIGTVQRIADALGLRLEFRPKAEK